jgi:hypothetical protein
VTPDARLEAAPVSGTVRALLYLALTVALVLAAGVAGSSYGDAQCRGEGDDCPEAIIGSLLFTAGAVFAMVILVATCEITLHARRRRRPA